MSKPPQERRAELVLAARRLFDEKGVEKTRVSDIVGTVGVAQGVFYYYFPSKEAMVQEVVRQTNNEMETRMKETLENPKLPFADKMVKFWELYLEIADRFAADETDGGKEAVASSLSALPWFGMLPQKLAVLVSQGVELGEIKAEYPQETARMLLLGMQPYAAQPNPDTHAIFTIIEQAFGLKKNTLRQHVQKKKNKR